MGLLHADVFPIAIRLVLMIAMFSNAIDFEAADVTAGVEIGTNSMAIVKAVWVAAAGILGAMGWWKFAAVRSLCTMPAGVLAIVFGALYFVTLPFSIFPAVSLVGGIAFNSYLLLLFTALMVVGPDRVFRDAIASLFLLLCVAWFCYFAIPSIGVYLEKAGAQGTIGRMTGLAHPNTLGGISGLFVILVLAGYESGKRSFWLYASACLFGLATIAATLSRTAMVACLVGVFGFNRHWFWHRYVISMLIPCIFFGALGLMYVDTEYGLDRVLDKALVSVSKTKDANEIKSATGRTEIWAYAIKLISQRPIFGYGAGTAPLLMEHHSFQTHNIILNPTLGFGLVGGIVISSMLLLNLYWAFHSTSRFVSAVCFFILISGLTEDTILSTFPESTTLIWLIASLTPYVDFAKRRCNPVAEQPQTV